ncbi:hypothetical protein CJ030_MR1G014923 [Morella rubra]|uniref:Uncharacterized protein n=1 Tax=Morella rubra TaxID=262757 RepID=A0A6A1WNZ6_9ROSI|nr:hypothetical protein CJ030_MR1G014923 [Morella rubra]
MTGHALKKRANEATTLSYVDVSASGFVWTIPSCQVTTKEHQDNAYGLVAQESKRHFTASFPGYDGDFFSFSVARVLHDACVELSEELGGVLYGLLELGLVSLVRVDAEQHVLPPHEVELRGRVVETCDTENVPDSVSVQPRLWRQSAAMRREQGTKAKNLYALSEAAEHLAVHALKRIGANGRCREKQRRYRVLSRNYNREQHYMPSGLG